MNAHIRKQLSAAEITDSTAHSALLFRKNGFAMPKSFSSPEKTETKTPIITAEKNCAAKSRKPVPMLPKTPIPTAEIKKGGPALTQ